MDAQVERLAGKHGFDIDAVVWQVKLNYISYHHTGSGAMLCEDQYGDECIEKHWDTKHHTYPQGRIIAWKVLLA